MHRDTVRPFASMQILCADTTDMQTQFLQLETHAYTWRDSVAACIHCVHICRHYIHFICADIVYAHDDTVCPCSDTICIYENTEHACVVIHVNADILCIHSGTVCGTVVDKCTYIETHTSEKSREQKVQLFERKLAECMCHVPRVRYLLRRVLGSDANLTATT